MGTIVVVGAGIAGLSAALLLGRRGQRVVLCERDAAPVPADLEAMWTAWSRPGLPQARLGHGFSPRFLGLLRDHAPDVLQRLREAGGTFYDLAAFLPGGQERIPADDELVPLLCRRPVLEGLLRQAVEAEPTVELLGGRAVIGLLAAPTSNGDVPRVAGVRTRDGAEIAAETVILAGGRHMPVAAWLAELGAQPPAEEHEGCGQLWFTRYYRAVGEHQAAAAQLLLIEDLGYLMYSALGSDRGTLCVELGIPVGDDGLHGLHEEARFMAAIRSMPVAAPWTEPERATPISTIAPMGQEQNLLRRFVRDGRPTALGLHVVGDGRCRTNSLYAWGAGIALAEVVALVELLMEHRGDPLAQALAFEAAPAEEVAGWYGLSLARDRARMRAYRGEPAWDTAAGPGTEDFVQTVVLPAMGEDPDVFRAVMRQGMQLDPPEALAANTAIQQRAQELAAVRPPPAEPAAPRGPTRDALLEILAAAAESTRSRRAPA